MRLVKQIMLPTMAAGLATALAFSANTAQAANALEPLMAQGLNVWIDDSAETLEDRDGDNLLGVGDSLYGMFRITVFRNFSGWRHQRHPRRRGNGLQRIHRRFRQPGSEPDGYE